MNVDSNFYSEFVGQISQNFAFVENLLLGPKILKPFYNPGLQFFAHAPHCHKLGEREREKREEGRREKGKGNGVMGKGRREKVGEGEEGRE